MKLLYLKFQPTQCSNCKANGDIQFKRYLIERVGNLGYCEDVLVRQNLKHKKDCSHKISLAQIKTEFLLQSGTEKRTRKTIITFKEEK
jgi:hypothetical protein